MPPPTTDDVVTVWLVAELGEAGLSKRKLELDGYALAWAGRPQDWPGLSDDVPDLIMVTAAAAGSRRWLWIAREAEQNGVLVAVMGPRPDGPDDRLGNAQALPRPG